MGQGSSRPDKQIAELPEDERYFGFENFGNTCYCNSVLQALYFCKPFRERVLEYAAQLQGRNYPQENILTCLAELFAQINSQRKKTGFLSPRKFVNRVKAEHQLFSSYMHQDAHEFLNYILNQVSEILEKEEKEALATSAAPRQNGSFTTTPHNSRHPDFAMPSPSKVQRTSNNNSSNSKPGTHAIHARTPSLQELHQMQQDAAASSNTNAPVRTWVDELFRGRLVNQTRCLRCETVTSREEDFYDLSLEIDQNCSVTSCLRRFSSVETLDGNDKFSCDACGCLQEAQKGMKLAKLPPVLCLHLKRFKYMEQLGQMKKLTHRVVFPFDLKLCNTTPDCPEADVSYRLFAVVVHMGAHIHHGHYVALVKSQGCWVCFDDDQVMPISPQQVQSTFGHTQEQPLRADQQSSHMDHGYILFYLRQPEEERSDEEESSGGDEYAEGGSSPEIMD